MYKKFVKVNSQYIKDGLYCTPKAYREVTLRMSTGDFATHKKEVVYLSEKEIVKQDDLNNILRHITFNEAIKDFLFIVKELGLTNRTFNEHIQFLETKTNYILIGDNNVKGQPQNSFLTPNIE